MRCSCDGFALRIDGFVSVQAPLAGGEFVTKPIIFDGGALEINFSTSAAGSIRWELQDVAGNPLPGFSLAENPEIFGDSIDYTVPLRAGTDLRKAAGKPVRLRFTLRDADLYAFRFK